jgi:hypothetical protein
MLFFLSSFHSPILWLSQVVAWQLHRRPECLDVVKRALPTAAEQTIETLLEHIANASKDDSAESNPLPTVTDTRG